MERVSPPKPRRVQDALRQVARAAPERAGLRPSGRGVPGPCRRSKWLHRPRHTPHRRRGISLSGERAGPVNRPFVQQSPFSTSAPAATPSKESPALATMVPSGFSSAAASADYTPLPIEPPTRGISVSFTISLVGMPVIHSVSLKMLVTGDEKLILPEISPGKSRSTALPPIPDSVTDVIIVILVPRHDFRAKRSSSSLNLWLVDFSVALVGSGVFLSVRPDLRLISGITVKALASTRAESSRNTAPRPKPDRPRPIRPSRNKDAM